MLAIRVAFVFALLLAGCDPAAPASPSPEPPETPPRAEADARLTPATATLHATPDADLRVGDTVEVCWQAPGRSGCTLSILHASGEGDFGEVPPNNCREVVVERTTLVELFCEGDTHALLQLEARDASQ